jgi:prevent-host-death family protein
MKHTWQLQEAKNRFSQLVDEALVHGPQTITRHGQKTVVIISYEEYRKSIGQPENLVAFLKKSPLRGIDLDLDRDKDTGRDIEL